MPLRGVGSLDPAAFRLLSIAAQTELLRQTTRHDEPGPVCPRGLQAVAHNPRHPSRRVFSCLLVVCCFCFFGYIVSECTPNNVHTIDAFNTSRLLRPRERFMMKEDSTMMRVPILYDGPRSAHVHDYKDNAFGIGCATEGESQTFRPHRNIVGCYGRRSCLSYALAHITCTTQRAHFATLVEHGGAIVVADCLSVITSTGSGPCVTASTPWQVSNLVLDLVLRTGFCRCIAICLARPALCSDIPWSLRPRFAGDDFYRGKTGLTPYLPRGEIFPCPSHDPRGTTNLSHWHDFAVRTSHSVPFGILVSRFVLLGVTRMLCIALPHAILLHLVHFDVRFRTSCDGHFCHVVIYGRLLGRCKSRPREKPCSSICSEQRSCMTPRFISVSMTTGSCPCVSTSTDAGDLCIDSDDGSAPGLFHTTHVCQPTSIEDEC